jgi:hypothetical protein
VVLDGADVPLLHIIGECDVDLPQAALDAHNALRKKRRAQQQRGGMGAEDGESEGEVGGEEEEEEEEEELESLIDDSELGEEGVAYFTRTFRSRTVTQQALAAAWARRVLQRALAQPACSWRRPPCTRGEQQRQRSEGWQMALQALDLEALAPEVRDPVGQADRVLLPL